MFKNNLHSINETPLKDVISSFNRLFESIEYETEYDNGGCDAIALAICDVFDELYPEYKGLFGLAVIQRKTYKVDGLRAIENNSCSHVVAYNSRLDITYDWEGPRAFERWQDNWIDEYGNETVFTLKPFKSKKRAIDWLSKNKSYKYEESYYLEFISLLKNNDLVNNKEHRVELKFDNLDLNVFGIDWIKCHIIESSLDDFVKISNQVLSSSDNINNDNYIRNVRQVLDLFKYVYDNLKIENNSLIFNIRDDLCNKHMSDSNILVRDLVIKPIIDSLYQRMLKLDLSLENTNSEESKNMLSLFFNEFKQLSDYLTPELQTEHIAI